MGERANNSKNSRKKTIIAVILLCMAVAAFAIIYVLLMPQGVAGAKSIIIEVTADGSTFTSEVRTDALYLREVLDEQEMIDGMETDFGFWLTTVRGRTANDAEMEWWSIYINGEFAMTGVNDTPVIDGEIYGFELKVGYDDFF
jgi:hypothetical protein